MSNSDNPPAPRSTCPHARNAGFIERVMMDEVMARCQPGAQVALVGSAGVGKSHIAIEYAYRVRESSSQTWVFWVDATDAASIRDDYQNIARELRLPGYDNKKTNILTLVRDWLCLDSNDSWKMIIDGADNPHALIRSARKSSGNPSKVRIWDPVEVCDFMPTSPNGTVLITSTNIEAIRMLTENSTHHLVIEGMKEDEALALLRSRIRDHVPCTKDDAISLVQAAEYIPLVISQISTCMIKDGLTTEQAIEKLSHPEFDAARLLERNYYEPSRDVGGTNSIVKSWYLTFNYVRERKPSAARLLSLMCLFDRQDIPQALLRGQYGRDVIAAPASTQPCPSWVTRIRKECLNILKRGSEDEEPAKDFDRGFKNDWRVLNNLMLIKTNLSGSQFSMTRLMQWAITRWLEKNGELELWSMRYFFIMKTVFPTPTHDNLELCRCLFPHARKVEMYRPSDPNFLKTWARLLQDIAQFAEDACNYNAAESLLRTALEALEVIAGDGHEFTLQCLHQLGKLLNRVQNYPEAELLLRKAWANRLALFGEYHVDSLDSAYLLGSVLESQGKWDEGETLQLRTIDAKVRLFGPAHKETEFAIAQLAAGCMTAGRFEQAENLHRRILGIKKSLHGEEVAHSRNSMRCLAISLSMQGKAHEAEVIHRQILQDTEAARSLCDEETIKSINFLGEALTKQNKLREAAQFYECVQEVFAELEGCAHKEALETLDSLAKVLSQEGKLTEAEQLARMMIGEREKLFGTEHLDVFFGYHTLAKILTLQERFGPALELFEKAYVGTLANYGPEHPDLKEFLADFDAAKHILLIRTRSDWDS